MAGGFQVAAGPVAALAPQFAEVARLLTGLGRLLAQTARDPDLAASGGLCPNTSGQATVRLSEAEAAVEHARREVDPVPEGLRLCAERYTGSEEAVVAGLTAADPDPAPEPAPVVSSVRPLAGLSRAEILRRAKRWADLGLNYDMAGYFEGYRKDCSGLVSMAWGLPAPGLTTDTLPQVAHPIRKAELQPGDILLNTAPGAAGHTLIFTGWADAAHTRYFAYEESGGAGAHTTEMVYPYREGFGTFTPYRRNGLLTD